MRVLKESGGYLEEQIKHNKFLARIFLIVGLLTLIFGIGLIFILISSYFSKESGQYRKGEVGEYLITKYLQELNDDYYLINDIMLPGSYGNIDHIILGPTGIFIVETKNYEGMIGCEEDEWYRHYEGGFIFRWSKDYDIGSPSKQVKRNAVKLKQFIQKHSNKPIWIEGVVVFINPDVNLELDNPTVPILKIQELPEFIKNKKSKIEFTHQELESIGNTILMQDESNFN